MSIPDVHAAASAGMSSEPDGPPHGDASGAHAVQVGRSGAGSLTFRCAHLARGSAADAGVLSVAERARARDIEDPGLRARYVARRAFVRQVLGTYIDGTSYRGDFVLGKFGKPRLPPPHAWIGFNVSHAGDFIVAAIRPDGEIGVDVERRDRTVPPTLLDAVFNEDEQDCLSRCEDWRNAALFGWTCKEAVLKCLGCGLIRHPKQIKVFIKGDGVLNSVAYAFSERGDLDGIYEIISLPRSRGYLGAVAIPVQ